MATINNNLTPEQQTGIKEKDVTQGVVDLDVVEQKVEPLPEQPTPTPSRSTAFADSFIKNTETALSKAESDRKTEADRVATREAEVARLQGETLGRGQAEQTAIAQSIVPKAEKELQSLLSGIKDKATAIKEQRVLNAQAVADQAGRGLGIPMSLVRGKQALLQTQLENKVKLEEISLENDIATAELLQGNIDSARSAVERAVALKYEDKKAELANEITLLSRSDSKLAEAKKRELAEVEKLEQEENDIFSIAEQARSAGAGQAEINAIIKSETREEAIANAVTLGRMARIENSIRQRELDSMNMAMQEAITSGNVSEAEGAELGNQLNLISEILNPDKISALGAKGNVLDNVIGQTRLGLKAVRGLTPVAENDYISSVENILNSLTLNTFAEAKAKGMTFGAMSEGEWRILANTASRITQRRVKSSDKENARVIGYSGSKDAFLSDIKVIENSIKNRYKNATGVEFGSDTLDVDENGFINIDGELSNSDFFNQ